MTEKANPVMEGRRVSDSASEYSELALPNDANSLGNLLGGKIMHLVDLCGAIAAMRHSRSPVVTASVDHMEFIHPVHIGQMVRLRSSVNRAFRTSMEVGVKVWVEDLIQGEQKHVSSAFLTFVAIDKAGDRVEVPPVIPETEDEKRRYEDAGKRREYRLSHRRPR
jgi:acyl-CoA hydrolase